jgi:hypothetical protein
MIGWLGDLPAQPSRKCTRQLLGAADISTRAHPRQKCEADLLARIGLKELGLGRQEAQLSKQIAPGLSHVSDLSIDHRHHGDS